MFVNTNFSFSAKNICIPPRKIYEEKLTQKAIDFIRRLRFRAHFHENPHLRTEKREYYGLKSECKPPDVDFLEDFERDFWKLIRSVRYRSDDLGQINNFQKNLKSKISDMTKNDQKVIVKGDKSAHWYNCSKEKYHKVVTTNLRKFYKKEPKNNPKIVSKINENIEHYGAHYNVVDRIRKIKPQDVFITLKDHKVDFERTEPCRLINPTKSDLGVISKFILDRVILDLRDNFSPKINQFKNTDDCINWFKKLGILQRRAFLTFDIVDFYPSITEIILKKALFWAKEHLKPGILNDVDIDLILAARVSILAYKGDIWVKKTGEFDVTMGSPDGAEVSELVGLYLLEQLRQTMIILPKNSFGLYRDDGILAFQTASGRRQEYIRQDLKDFFAEQGFKIEISPASSFIDYLDVRLHVTGEHEIYYKENADTKYVHIQSNHPCSVLKNFKTNTENRLSKLCSEKSTFDRHADRFKDILAKSGHPTDLKYSLKPAQKSKKKKRNQRTVSWFNPPFNLDVKTNLGKQFFTLCADHFGKPGPLKFLNKNTVKLSYCTMGNAKAIFNSHNKKVLSDKPKTKKPCKCNKTYAGVARTCTIPDICNETDVVYAARVTEDGIRGHSTYYGLTMNPLKHRVNAHLRSFEEGNNQGKTKLSRHILDIRERGSKFDVKWTVERRRKHWTGGKGCSLCLGEKTMILFNKEPDMLNQRKELFSTCRHQHEHRIESRRSEATDDDDDDEDDVFHDCTNEVGNDEEPVQADSFSQNLFNWLQGRQKKKK